MNAAEQKVPALGSQWLIGSPTGPDIAGLRPLLGGKAWRCALLRQNGFPVPSSLVVTTAVYRAHLELWHLELSSEVAWNSTCGDELACLQSSLRSGQLDPSLVEGLSAYLQSVGPVAVRSSATVEDGEHASAAGLFSTSLWVEGLDAVAAAIRACWASLWTTESVEYQRKCNHSPAEMAVLIMPMVRAQASGVVFTCDPVSGAATVVVESQDAPGEFPQIVELARRTEALFGQPQDIEWAVDMDERSWILQSRDVTVEPAPPPNPVTPGPGVWHVIDHIARPSSRCLLDVYFGAMQEGWNAGAKRIGLNARMRIQSAAEFMYYQSDLVEADSEAEQKAEHFLQGPGFRDELAHWDHHVKPANVLELSTAQAVDLRQLDDAALAVHLCNCATLARRMVACHHEFTCPSFVGMGDALRSLQEWSGWSPLEVLSVFGNGQTPLRVDHTVQVLGMALRGAPELLSQLAETRGKPELARVLLTRLMARQDEIGEGMQYLWRRYSGLVSTGYDIVAETYSERPDLLLGTVRAFATSTRDGHVPKNSPSADALAAAVPPQHREQVAGLVWRGAESLRLRDERALCSDLWAMGILRLVYLEAARRLINHGQLLEPRLLLEAAPDDVASWLQTRTAKLPVDILRRKLRYRQAYDVADVPSTLGDDGASAPRGPAAMGPAQARTLAAFGITMELAVDRPRASTASDVPSVIAGTPASIGRACGPACVIHTEADIARVRTGDVLVLRQATVALNAILPQAAALISEGGGVLSHQAILAREYGVPCVVGCSNVFARIHNGMMLAVNAASGEVRIESQHDDRERKLKELVCDYAGPTRGRNRLRALNHIDEMKGRLGLLGKVRANPTALAILAQHSERQLSTESALAELGAAIGEERAAIVSFSRRAHVELHPSDACELACHGCTYQPNGKPRRGPSFPFSSLSHMQSVLQPRAITLVGGGEPTMYAWREQRLGDLIVELGTRGIAVGLISNGVSWPSGDPQWPRWTRWIRFSLDAASPESYSQAKGRNAFSGVVENVLRALRDTQIGEVGVGFLYHPGNASETVELVQLFHGLLSQRPIAERQRFNIQFRPWRDPEGRHPIDEPTLETADVNMATDALLESVAADPSLAQFLHEHTNLATNLLCAGARLGLEPFSECLVGLAKVVVRADGSLYPCFGVAARNLTAMQCGNLVSDDAEHIALRMLEVMASRAPAKCAASFQHCLFCAFNNLLDRGARGTLTPDPRLREDFFF